jgi:hypothetical protein
MNTNYNGSLDDRQYGLDDADFLDLQWEKEVTAFRERHSARGRHPLNLTSQIEGYLRNQT